MPMPKPGQPLPEHFADFGGIRTEIFSSARTGLPKIAECGRPLRLVKLRIPFHDSVFRAP